MFRKLTNRQVTSVWKKILNCRDDIAMAVACENKNGVLHTAQVLTQLVSQLEGHDIACALERGETIILEPKGE